MRVSAMWAGTGGSGGGSDLAGSNDLAPQIACANHDFFSRRVSDSNLDVDQRVNGELADLVDRHTLAVA